MTEPVAWRVEDVSETLGWRYSTLKPITKGYEPLYTAEQLHPRVKMTQSEFDEFKILKSLNPTVDLIAILKTVSNFKYKNLQSRFVCGSIENQTEFATLWLRARYARLEELIEIIPDMKWFVRSKEQYEPDMDQGIAESGYLYLTQGDIYSIEYYETTTFKDEAQQFDTKEEAELWTNPLTEVVQLPVEEQL
ncbi:hypothetical protein [Leuconostoc lactis]|uniref:hypothetical protein n=1 Tax=Leuconostoc lactis TaxID=1246 RepID=UPI0021A4C400|nr:hypothetical protein [Leuconostoc lactis]MCT3116202.1 hypothetical protein [Leuconostoc lactis]